MGGLLLSIVCQPKSPLLPMADIANQSPVALSPRLLGPATPPSLWLVAGVQRGGQAEPCQDHMEGGSPQAQVLRPLRRVSGPTQSG